MPSGASRVSAKWGDPEGLPLLFAQNLHWRALADHCYLTFGEMELPLVDGPLPDGTTIEIRPIVRIAATPEAIRAWAALLTQAAAEYPQPKDK